MHNDEARVIAASLLRMKTARDISLGGELFACPAWDMLLLLFSADEPADVCALARSIGVRENLAQRWLQLLIDREIVRTEAHTPTYYVLTQSAVESIGAILCEAVPHESAMVAGIVALPAHVVKASGRCAAGLSR